MEGGRTETAEQNGRVCEICRLETEDKVCQECVQVLVSFEETQKQPEFGDSMLSVIQSLQTWSQEIPTWNIVDGLLNLLKPSVRRFDRSQNPRKGPFIAFEGIDGSGKTFHMDVAQEFLVNSHYPVHNSQRSDKVGALSQNMYERILTLGCLDTTCCFPSIETINARTQLSSVYADLEFQEQIYDLYQEPSIWEGIRVLRHQTSDNKWECCEEIPCGKWQIDCGYIYGSFRESAEPVLFLSPQQKNVRGVWNV